MVVRLKPWELIQILIILKILYQKRILILILIVIQLIYVLVIMRGGDIIYMKACLVVHYWLDPDLVVFLDCTFQRCSEDIFFLKFRNNQYPHQFGWQVSQEDLDSKILNHKHYLEKHKPDLVRKCFKHLIDQNSKKLFKELTDV